jgi:hypothetical protein
MMPIFAPFDRPVLSCSGSEFCGSFDPVGVGAASVVVPVEVDVDVELVLLVVLALVVVFEVVVDGFAASRNAFSLTDKGVFESEHACFIVL